MVTRIIKNINLLFESSPRCFSPKNIDKGTLAMLSYVEFKETDKVLDLGCGYGVVGILAAKFMNPKNVYLIDNCKVALKYATKNAMHNNVDDVNIIFSDSFKNLNESGFSLILCNPPYHTDFSVPKNFIVKGFNRLLVGGKFYMVTKRLNWYRNKFISIFGGVKVYEKDSYYIFEAEKRSSRYKPKS